jgi:ATP-dependent helicase YprA (DUF1998 family)
LAQDQLRSLLALTGDGRGEGYLPVGVAVCDGDTSQADRASIWQQQEGKPTNIILTNPDMLHCTLLPQASVRQDISISTLFSIVFLIIQLMSPVAIYFGLHVH